MSHSVLKPAFGVCVCVLVLAACTLQREAEPPTLAPFPGSPTAGCVLQELLPNIEGVQPAEIRPGSEVTVTARGGYLRDNCGGYIEGSRIYQLYFDDQVVADLACYVNYCQGKFVLGKGVAPGPHCMGVQKGTCQLEVQVVGD